MIALAARLRGGLASPLGLTVAAFATLSALARSIGILRWLTVMPVLAAAHAAADPAARGQIEFVFDALTTYGGGIGEVLGVSLFMALALGLLAIGALRRRRPADLGRGLRPRRRARPRRPRAAGVRRARPDAGGRGSEPAVDGDDLGRGAVRPGWPA